LEVGKEIRIDVLVVFSLFLRLGFARTQTLRNSGTLFHPNLPAASKRSSEAGMVRAYITEAGQPKDSPLLASDE